MVVEFLPGIKMASEVGSSTLLQGNTSVVDGTRRKARAYQLTLNEPERYEELVNALTGYKSLKYLISCKETAPTTGHEHIHIYVNFRNMIKLTVKKTCGAHIEVCRGTPKQNIAYIEKGEVIEEIGERPHQGTMSVGELAETEDPRELDYKMYNTWKAVRNTPRKQKVDGWHKKVEVIYITGPSGAGKSLRAKEILHERGLDEFEEIKCVDGFWHGVVDGTGAAVYDDYRPSHLSASEFINLIDYNVHNLNIKGGSVRNQYDLVIITSVIDPEDLYMNMPEEARTQWLRRMKVEHIDVEHRNWSPELEDLDEFMSAIRGES